MNQQTDIIREFQRIVERRKKDGKPYIAVSTAVWQDFCVPMLQNSVPAMEKEVEKKPQLVKSPSLVKQFSERRIADAPDSTQKIKQTAVVRQLSAEKKMESLELDSFGWQDLESAILKCQNCDLTGECNHKSLGEGNRQAKLMFIREVPRADEDLSENSYYVGSAGEILDRMIAAMGFQLQEVYIANIVMCRPLTGRHLFQKEIDACLPFVRQQIKLIKPSAIVLLGNTAIKNLTSENTVTKIHGTWLGVDGVPAMPTFSPAFLKRSPSWKRAAWEDLKKVMAFLTK